MPWRCCIVLQSPLGMQYNATRRDGATQEVQLRYISVFSGIEAASVAWGPLGWEPVAFCEVDGFPSAVLSERFPDVPNLGDITKADWSEYNGAVDLVVGGSPCQSFSVAGNRTGLDGASGLMWEYVRCVREVRPRWFVWENVPGALSSAKGRTSDACSRAWMNSGTVWHGEYSTRSSSEWPKDAVACSLSEVLETDVPQTYSLSQRACAGILRRAEKRGKPLPAELREALERVAFASKEAW